jgi:hypothetical protein
MAEVEVDTCLRLVLTKEKIKALSDAVDSIDGSWIRLVVETEVGEPCTDRLTAYVQGPNGEERELYLALL